MTEASRLHVAFAKFLRTKKYHQPEILQPVNYNLRVFQCKSRLMQTAFTQITQKNGRITKFFEVFGHKLAKKIVWKISSKNQI